MTEITANATPPRRRAVRWLLRMVIGIFAIAALLGAILLWTNNRSSRALAEAIVETDRVDPNWRIADLEANRTAVADDVNAALRIMNLVARMPADPLDAGAILGDKPPNESLTADQSRRIASVLEPLADLPREARKLAEFSAGRFPITYPPGFMGTKTHDAEIIRARDLLLADLLDRIASGDAAEAVRSWKALFVVGQTIGDEPLIASQLVRATLRRSAIDALERLLAQFELEEGALASIQAALESDEPQPLALYAIRGERAGSFELFEMLTVNGAKKSSWDIWSRTIRNVVEGKMTPSEAFAVLPGSLPGQQATILRFHNRIIAVLQQPVESWSPQLAALDAEVGSLPALARMTLPAVVKVGATFRKSHADMRCAIVAVAAERFRRLNGKWPDALPDLVAADLFSAVPLDPFDDEPLRLKRTADGFVVYSLGDDGIDGGGDVTRKSSGPQSRDLGVRLWDVNKRKQPSVGQP